LRTERIVFPGAEGQKLAADHLLTRKEDAIYAANLIAAWAVRYLN